MEVVVSNEVFQPWKVLSDYESARSGLDGEFGASAVFVGTMRAMNEGHTVDSMVLEHYPGMTEKYLKTISREASARWQLQDCFVQHRYGLIRPGEPIVLVATWSGHRQQALAACQYIIDELKTRAPFWKKEFTEGASHWVNQTP